MRAVGSLKRSLPSLHQQGAYQLLLAHRENAAFQTAYETCFGGVVAHLQEEHARPGPFQMGERREEQKLDLTRAELDTLLVQWCLLEPLLRCAFPDVLEQNRLALFLRLCFRPSRIIHGCKCRWRASLSLSNEHGMHAPIPCRSSLG